MAPRGKILDRNGNVLALDIKGYSVGIDLEKFKFEEETITFLSEQLDKDFFSLSNILYGKTSGYKEISRNINLETKEKLKEKKIPGVYFRENLRRSYPEKNITSHVVGLTDIDRKGIQGVELIFDNELRGEEGSFEGIKGAKNTKLEGKRVEAVSGKNIALTIEINIQSFPNINEISQYKKIMRSQDL